MEETSIFNDIFKVIKKYFWILLLSMIIGVVIGQISASSGPAPTFRTSALVLLKKNGGTVVNSPDEIGRFMNTAQILVEIPSILEKVKNDLDLSEDSVELASKIEVTNENNSQIIRISTEDNDANKATKIVNTTAENFAKEIGHYLDVEAVEVIQKAVNGQETEIIHTRTKANLIMGGIIGLIVGSLVVLVLKLINNRKKVF